MCLSAPSSCTAIMVHNVTMCYVAGKLSDGIAQLRAAAVQCFNEYIAKHNLDSAEG